MIIVRVIGGFSVLILFNDINHCQIFQVLCLLPGLCLFFAAADLVTIL
jgi:hypothetical protein